MNSRKLLLTIGATVVAFVALGVYWLLATFIMILVFGLVRQVIIGLNFLPNFALFFVYEVVLGWFAPMFLWAVGGASAVWASAKIFKSANIKFVVFFLSFLVIANLIFALAVQPLPIPEIGGLWLWIAQAFGVILGAFSIYRTTVEHA